MASTALITSRSLRTTRRSLPRSRPVSYTHLHKYLHIARENYYNVKKAGSGNTFNLGVNLYANDDAFIADRTAVRAGDTLSLIHI